MRSVLYAVYRLLKENGCRFLFPGKDGEYIPEKQLEGVSYHKMADHRIRAHTTEGDPTLEMLHKTFDDFCQYDYEMERYFDFALARASLNNVVRVKPKIEL